MLIEDTLALPTTPEGSALISQKFMPSGKYSHDQKSNTRFVCEYCHVPGHTKDKSWHLHGEPPNWQPKKKKDGKAYHAQPTEGNSGPASIPLSNEQL